jgi:hypothetical protein
MEQLKPVGRPSVLFPSTYPTASLDSVGAPDQHWSEDRSGAAIPRRASTLAVGDRAVIRAQGPAVLGERAAGTSGR